MKKMYIAPEVELLTMNVEMPMAMSIKTDAGVGYGGIALCVNIPGRNIPITRVHDNIRVRTNVPADGNVAFPRV